MSLWIVSLLIVGLSFVETVGDSLIKYSGNDKNKYVLIVWLVLGVLVYMTAAFGWFFVMKHVKLGSLGLIYAVSTVSFLLIMGVLVFNETYSKSEILGVILGFVSLFLLARAL